MKKIMFAFVILVSVIGSAQPQKPPPAEERWRHDSKIIKEKTSFDETTIAKMKTSFMTFYKNMDEMMEKSKGERPKKEDVEPIIKKRNDALKAVLKDSQFQSFIKIEKELGPRPPGDRNGTPPPRN